MNPQQAKSLFFSQHWGQKIQTNKFEEKAQDEPALVGAYGLDWHLIDTDYLLLRSVSQLTDEELETIAKLCGFEEQEGFFLSGEGVDIIDSVYGDSGNVNYPPADYVNIHQYLLRIGILLQFTYLNEVNKPVTLQPDEIVKLGWAKINEA